MKALWRIAALVVIVVALALLWVNFSQQPRLISASTQELNGLTFDILRYDLGESELELRIQRDQDYAVDVTCLAKALQPYLENGQRRYHRLVWLWTEDQWSATAGAAGYNAVAIIIGKAGLDLSQIPPPRDLAFWEVDRNNLPVHLNKVAWHELDHAIKFYTSTDPSKDVKYEVAADNFAKRNWKKPLIIIKR